MEAKLLPCSVRAPVLIGITNGAVEFHSGCAIIDVTFPKSSGHVDICKIYFKNYYTANLKLLARKSAVGTSSEKAQWKPCIHTMQLMPFPHCEQASEDYFTIKASDALCPLQGVAELRFVLRQPSPMWKEFKIEEIQIYKMDLSAESLLPAWISDLGKKEEDIDRQLKGITSVAQLSKQMQQLWALTEQARISQTKSALGRYDVDGCYDINLLSHT